VNLAGNAHLKKAHPVWDGAGGLAAFVVARKVGFHPLLALAAGGAVWWFLP
jgi:hypothetical protein